MKICVAYKGISYDPTYSHRNGSVYCIDMREVYENHQKYIWKPLKERGHSIVTAISTNESEILEELKELFGFEYCDTTGTNQFDRGHNVLSYVAKNKEITHVIVVRCDLLMKCPITFCPIRWDKVNFAWKNTWKVCDNILVMPQTKAGEMGEGMWKLHKLGITHGHGIHKRFYKERKDLQYWCCGDYDKVKFYDSNSDNNQNPIYMFTRNTGKEPLIPQVKRLIAVFPT